MTELAADVTEPDLAASPAHTLVVTDLVAGYGDLVVVSGASLEARTGEVLALVGPNGAGKTTFLMALAGLLRSRSGAIEIDGVNVAGRPTIDRLRAGLVLVPQGRELFGPMSARENLWLGAYDKPRRSELNERVDRVVSIFPDLATRMEQKVGAMSGGQQQMVAIGRALMADPKFLFLDEPSLGLAPLMVKTVLSRLRAMADDGMAVVVVEQEADAVLRLADRAAAMRVGRFGASRPAAELLDPAVLFDLYFSHD